MGMVMYIVLSALALAEPPEPEPQLHSEGRQWRTYDTRVALADDVTLARMHSRARSRTDAGAVGTVALVGGLTAFWVAAGVREAGAGCHSIPCLTVPAIGTAAASPLITIAVASWATGPRRVRRVRAEFDARGLASPRWRVALAPVPNPKKPGVAVVGQF